MKQSIFLSLLCIATSTYAATWTIGVGKDETTGRKGIGFDPSSIRPAVGDTILFEFRSGRHSAVESTFDSPCTPKAGGFATDVYTVDDSIEVDAKGLPSQSTTVTSTEPHWFYDAASGECNKGALFSVNPSLEFGKGTAGEWKEKALALPDSALVDPSTQEGGSSSTEAGGPSPTSPNASGSSPSPTNAASKNLVVGIAGVFAFAGTLLL